MMNFDFAALLVLLTFLSGAIWLGDTMFFARHRSVAVPKREGQDDTGAAVATPLLVDYARSFFPIFLFVLVLRSFIAEPFRIPSASMMPTLLIGDFILVNKYDYGIRLPVINLKIIQNKTPQRGDIIVFRYPQDPKIPFIKRVVGLPGDHIAYYDKMVHINGNPVQQMEPESYQGAGAGKIMDGVSRRLEQLGSIKHDILVEPAGYSSEFEGVVPPGQYFVLGDNRDNSRDSRYWGYVPDANLIGRAFMIWMNWDIKNDGIEWGRIGTMLN
ncbi:MAG: signal peptidase I [Gammaproteobacteria bacterium]